MTWGWGQHFPGSRNKMYKTWMPKTACHILKNHKKFLITVSKICGQTWNVKKRAVQKRGGQRTRGGYHQDVGPWFWQLCDSDMAELHLQLDRIGRKEWSLQTGSSFEAQAAAIGHELRWRPGRGVGGMGVKLIESAEIKSLELCGRVWGILGCQVRMPLSEAEEHRSLGFGHWLLLLNLPCPQLGV